MATWHSVHLGVCLLGFCLLGSLATRHSAHVGLCPLLILSTLGSAHLRFFLLGSQSTWVVVFLEIVYLGVLLHDILPKWDCVHYLFCQLCILLAFGLFYLGFYLPGSLLTWNLSSWKFSNMTFCRRWYVSTNGSVNSWFCSRLVLSSSKSVQLGVCLLEFYLSWEPSYMTFCPPRIVSNISSMNSGFYLRLILSTLDYVNKGFFLFEIMSTWHSVHLGVCLLGFCLLGRPATRHSAHVGLCPLLIPSTLGSAHLWFFLLGSQSTLIVVFLKIVYLGVLIHDILPKWDCVHYWICQLRILLTFGSVYLGFSPTGSLPTWILSTSESGHMTFCPRRIASSIGSDNSAFCSWLVLSSWKFVQLGVCLLEFCPSWESGHMTFC